MSIAVLGCGVSGILVCLELARLGTDMTTVTCIDPYFDGGALARTWGGILSNTRWVQITEALRDYPTAQKPIQVLSQQYGPEERVLLSDLGYLLQESIRPFVSEMNLCISSCSSIQQTGSAWQLRLGKTLDTTTVQKVLLCQGGKAKTLDMGKPLIPLEVALDPERLIRMIRPNQTVVVFGLQHSGTLVLKHLLACSAKVVAVYKGDSPFLFEKDGNYDGIKQESAELAERFLNSPPAGLEFVHSSNTPKLLKQLTKASWIVCSIGFETAPIEILAQDGSPLSYESYNPDSAEVYPNLYGFGLAYPGVTVLEGKQYKDVSIPSFVAQIRRCLPNLLSKC